MTARVATAEKVADFLWDERIQALMGIGYGYTRAAEIRREDLRRLARIKGARQCRKNYGAE